MRKISNVTTPRSLTVHVQAYKAEGDRAKYSLHARFQTAHTMYYLAHFDWDLNLAMAGLMDLLEKQVLKAKERRGTDRPRGPPPKGGGGRETPTQPFYPPPPQLISRKGGGCDGGLPGCFLDARPLVRP